MAVTDKDRSIAVFGAGSWGTALAVVLARNGFDVVLCGREVDDIAEIARQRCNPRYLPDIAFPDGLRVTDDLAMASNTTRQWLLVIPSPGFRDTLQSIVTVCDDNDLNGVTIAWGTKGFEPATGRLLSQVVDDVAGSTAAQAVISGPSFAGEVALGRPTALTVASAAPAVAERVARWLRNDHLRVYTNLDISGVQLGGAIKNVIAIATGICDGMGLGANAQAALVTRGLAELCRLGEALGGKPETFMGLTGLGDLVLTCTDDQSRNRRLGIALGRGQSLDEALRDVAQEAEGIHTARALHGMSQRLKLQMPITEQVYKVLFEGHTPAAAVASLLQRDPRPE